MYNFIDEETDFVKCLKPNAFGLQDGALNVKGVQ